VYNDITDLDQSTAWVIGILEGEGCFTPHTARSKKNGPNGYVSARIQVQMIDYDVIERLARYFDVKANGPYSYKGKKQDIYMIQLGGKRAKAWMLKHIYYFSERRRKQILAALSKLP